MKTTAVLCIGDELLDGRVGDENARHLTTVAADHRLEIDEVRIVGDDERAIAHALTAFSGRELVVASGGLGPTSDDVTRQAVADFVDRPLVENADSLRRLKQRFERHKRTFTDNNRRQCLFPEGAEILETDVGSADGFAVVRDNTRYLFFPGVPREFRWFLKRHLPDSSAQPAAPFSKTLVFFGRGESALATRIDDVVERIEPLALSVGFRAEFPLVEMTLKGDDELGGQIEGEILERIGRWLVAEDDETIAARVGERLVEADATVSVAESCTAGMLGAMLTEVSGSSRYFEEGYLTYANEAKVRLVGVNPEVLETHGAVSPQVACQMAAGARRRSGSDLALAISGVAGPTGGTETTPVGTVDIALATPEGTFHRRSNFPHYSRRQVRVLSIHVAMALLLWRLEGRLGEHRVDGPYGDTDVERGI